MGRLRSVSDCFQLFGFIPRTHAGVHIQGDIVARMVQEAVTDEEYTAAVLEMQTSAADEDLSGDVIRQRGAEEENGVSSLLRRAQPAERTGSDHGVECLDRDADLDLLAANAQGPVRYSRPDQTSVDQSETNCVHIDVVAPPLLCESLGESNHASFG